MKIFAALLATSSAATFASAAQTADIKPLIVGGSVVPVGAKTYTVGLRQTEAGTDFCGGALISPTHVLTAAHCAGYVKYVAVGTHFLSGTLDGVRVAVKKEIPHPSFNSGNLNYDYNILELASPVTARLSAPLPRSWAGAPRGPAVPSPTNCYVPVLSDAACKAAKIKPYPISATMFCAGGKANQDSCQGDSGGPLILERAAGDVLVGVVSWGEGCGVAGKPGVYSKVSLAKNWILANAPNATFV